jgi:hypothetical protein
MKVRALAVSVLLGLFLLAAAAPGQAQQPLRVKIPFDFVADKAALPAGEYVIQPSGLGSPALIVKRIDGPNRTVTTMMTHSVEANDQKPETCLVFRAYGDRYFLSEMWAGGARSGRQLYPSHIQKELAKNEISHEVILQAQLQGPKR